MLEFCSTDSHAALLLVFETAIYRYYGTEDPCYYLKVARCYKQIAVSDQLVARVDNDILAVRHLGSKGIIQEEQLVVTLPFHAIHVVAKDDFLFILTTTGEVYYYPVRSYAPKFFHRMTIPFKVIQIIWIGYLHVIDIQGRLYTVVPDLTIRTQPAFTTCRIVNSIHTDKSIYGQFYCEDGNLVSCGYGRTKIISHQPHGLVKRIELRSGTWEIDDRGMLTKVISDTLMQQTLPTGTALFQTSKVVDFIAGGKFICALLEDQSVRLIDPIKGTQLDVLDVNTTVDTIDHPDFLELISNYNPPPTPELILHVIRSNPTFHDFKVALHNTYLDIHDHGEDLDDFHNDSDLE